MQVFCAILCKFWCNKGCCSEMRDGEVFCLILNEDGLDLGKIELERFDFEQKMQFLLNLKQKTVLFKEEKEHGLNLNKEDSITQSLLLNLNKETSPNLCLYV